MKQRIAVALCAASAIFVLLAVSAFAEWDLTRSVAVSSTTDTNIMAKVWCYNADNTAPTLAVTSAVMSFTTAGTTADGNIMGLSTAGQIDCTSSAYDTWGEVQALVNAENSGWRMDLVGALPTDNIYSGSTNMLLNKSSTLCNTDAGCPLYADTSTWTYASFAIGLETVAGTSSNWDAQSLARRQNYSEINVNAESTISAGKTIIQPTNYSAKLKRMAIQTTGTGSSATFNLYEAKQDDPTGAETQLVFTDTGAATATDYLFPPSGINLEPIQSRPGYRLVGKYGGFTTTTACSVKASGEIGVEK